MIKPVGRENRSVFCSFWKIYIFFEYFRLVMCLIDRCENKGSSSKKSSKDTLAETRDVTDSSNEEEATSSASESTVKASGYSDSNTEPDQVDGTTESTVTASTATASSAGTPSESKEESSSVLPSVVTPISLSSIQAGDVITFGSFEQDNNTSNGAEEIEWIVATVEDGRALLLSKYVLYSMPFNSAGDVAWEESDVRE